MSLSTLKDANEVASGFRDLHRHESELLNHRFQWFALMNGLLFAAYGLLWEFKESAFFLMISIGAFGILVSFSSWMGARLTHEAHIEIDKLYTQLSTTHQLLSELPVRGLDKKAWWTFVLPWNFVFPLFCLFWGIVIVCTFCCPNPPVNTNQTKKAEQVGTSNGG